MKPIERQARKIQRSIVAVLAEAWDPIGVAGDPNADKEYEAYVGQLYRILVSNPSEDTIVSHLQKLEKDEIGTETTSETKKLVARKLLSLAIKLKP